MTIRISKSLGRALPLAATVLFLHSGSAAAANPQGDIQQQMSEVLTGSIATRAVRDSERAPANAVRVNLDAQASVQQFLLGWSVSHAGSADASAQKQQVARSESSQKPLVDEDFRSAVQRLLLGR